MQGFKKAFIKNTLIVSLSQDVQFFKLDAAKKYELSERHKKENGQIRSEL